MPATYTTSLSLTLPAVGDTNWGPTVNNGITSLVDDSVAGTTTITMVAADYTLTTTQGATNEARRMFLTLTGTPGAARNVIVPAVSKLYFVFNNTTGGFAQTVKTAAGSGISVPNGARMVLYCNGTNVVEALSTVNSLSVAATNLSFSTTGQRITGDFSNGTASNRLSFQSSTTNGITTINAIPNGTGTTSRFMAFNSSDTANACSVDLRATSTSVAVQTSVTGAGTHLPLYLSPGGSARLVIGPSSGNVGIGIGAVDPDSFSTTKLYVKQASSFEIFRLQTTTASNPASIYWTLTDAGTISDFSANGSKVTGTSDANSYSIYTNNAERVKISSTGALTSSDLADAVGYKGTPINSQSAAYALVMADQGKTILHPASDNNARTFTIPANGSVAYPVGTVLTFINLINTVTIAITTDTMYLAGTGATGSRTLAAYGMASAIKVGTTTWIISGNGLT